MDEAKRKGLTELCRYLQDHDSQSNCNMLHPLIFCHVISVSWIYGQIVWPVTGYFHKLSLRYIDGNGLNIKIIRQQMYDVSLVVFINNSSHLWRRTIKNYDILCQMYKYSCSWHNLICRFELKLWFLVMVEVILSWRVFSLHGFLFWMRNRIAHDAGWDEFYVCISHGMS